MEGLGQRAEKLARVGREIWRRREELIRAVAHDIGETRGDSQKDLQFVNAMLRRIGSTSGHLLGRSPICAAGEEVALVLSYNINNFASLHLAKLLLPGNRVRIRVSAQSSTVGRILESIWLPVFPRHVVFDFRPAKEFMEFCLTCPSVKAIFLFASENVAMQYEGRIRALPEKKFVFEGPGKDPFIVLDDGDYRKAVATLVSAKYVYSGQACWSPECVYVHKDVHAEFIKEFVSASKKLRTGDPLDPDTQVGPLVDQVAVSRISAQVKDAIRKGGKLLLGEPFGNGFTGPVIIDEANHDMTGMREESFGPVSFIQKIASADQAIELAKDSPYGLHATVWGWRDAPKVVSALAGENHLHEVPSLVFGKFGMMTINAAIPLAQKDLRRKGAARPLGLGGYGYSGWVWETRGGEFVLRQGPKAFDMESSLPTG